MKIAVPSADRNGLDSTVSEHFGRSPYFIIYDTGYEQMEIISSTNPEHGPNNSQNEPVGEHGHQGHGHGYAFRQLSSMSIDVLLCKGLGMRALTLFQQNGVKVLCGARGTVREALDAYKEGRLEEAGPDHACHHH